MKKTSRILSMVLACLMVLGVCPLGIFSATAAEATVANAQSGKWTDEDYASLYVTKGLLFKWDAFDLKAGETVTVLENQVAGGKNVTLDKVFNGSTLVGTSAVSTVSNGTEKDVVLGNTAAENLVANSTIDTNGALLTTATLDFSHIIPTHMVGDLTVLDDLTFEMTLFQQNYYGLGENETKNTLPKSAARFGPFSTARYIHDNQTYADTTKLNPLVPADESFGFMAHSTFSYSNINGINTAAITDLNPIHTANSNRKLYGNYRLQTYSVGVIFDFSVEDGETVGTFDFNYARDARYLVDYGIGQYDARYSGHWVGKDNPADAHNNFWFGGNLPFAYRAIRMYDRALTEAEMAQNHVAVLLDYYRVDLTVYNALNEDGRAMANEYLSTLRLGETSKKDIEKVLNTDEYKAMTYNYSELYIQDGLIFLWTGEGNELTATEQKVTAFENLVGEKDINKISYGRHYSHYYQGTSFTFYTTDKGVHNNGGNNFGLLLTDLVPTREYNGENILSDMTLEVSQAYPSTYQTKLGGTVKISTRNFDPGYMIFGALGNQSYTRVAYKQEYAKNEAGALRNFVPYYYIPNAYADDLTYEAEILYADTSASASAKAEFPLYRKNENGVMVKTTTDKHGNPIDDVYLDPKGNAKGDNAATGVYVSTTTGKLYYTYEPYYATRDSKVALNANGHIQGGTNLPATDVNGMGPISNWSGTLATYDYPRLGYTNFMNAYQDQVFTTTMIFNYDESAPSTSIPFTFTAGRDGALLNTTNHTYDTTKDYTPAEKKWDSSSKSDDNTTYNADNTVASTETVQKYAFSYGIGTAMTYYAIRLYDRVLTEDEQAHNNLVDIAYQLDVNLFDYIHAPYQYIKDYVLDATVGTSAADWTTESLAALIAEAYEEAVPPYYELYVQNGLTFLWSGEDYQISTSERSVSKLTNLLNPEQSINGTTWGRQAYNLIDKSGDHKALSYKVVDGGVIVDKDYRPILTDLVPYTVIDGKEVLTDMTLEISQSYFNTVKTSTSGATFTSTRGNDGGQAWYGPFGTISHTKSAYNAMYIGGSTYYYMLYKDAEGNFHPFYRKSHEVGLATTAFYTYDEESGTMKLITDEAVIARIREQTSDGKMANLYVTEAKQHTSTTFNNHNMHASVSAADAYGTAGVQSHSSAPFNNYDKYGAKQFLNNTVNEAFTSATVYNYRDTAITTKFDFSLVRDGQVLGTTNHNYDATVDKSKGWTTGGVYYGFSSDGNGTANHSLYYGGTEEPGKDEGRNFAFTFGATLYSILHSVRVYNRALTEDELAQNNFIDIATQLGLDLRAYATIDDDIKASVHALTKGRDAGDFEADELQAQVDLLVKGGREYAEMLEADILSFDGYAVRLYGYAGLRSLFEVNYDFVESVKKNAFVKIQEIGAIVAIKGEYNDAIEDLTVAGGKQMQKSAIYANGTWAEDNLIYRMNEEGELDACFALTTTFKNATEQTKAKYETELLYRGYVTIVMNGEEYTMYADMAAPSFAKISMCSVSEVFASRGWEYKDAAPIFSVLDTCDVAYEKKTYAAESFLNADGSIDTDSTGDLNIVFIGGSLTEGSGTKTGDKKWVQRIAEYIQSDVFPNKNVNWVNSGIGGTNSEGAAARFAEHVAAHNPDIIFVDYSVNDDMNGFTEERAQASMESFLYQCAQLEKVPTVIYLHTPPATLPNSAVYNKWYKQVTYKEEWAEHYSVETINIYNYSYSKWQKEIAAGDTTADYITWLDDYYGTLQAENTTSNTAYGRYDVHGGYQLYYEAIVAAFEERAEALLTPYRFMPYLQADLKDQIERTSITKYNNDLDFFTYSDGWKYYSKDGEQRTSGDLRIPVVRWEYPFMTNGVHEAPAGETVTFTTDANALTIYYMSVHSNVGSNFEVYVGGTKIATCGASSTYLQPFISNTVNLKNPNNEEIEVTIKVVAKDGIEEAYARFGSIWLSYYNN